MRDFKFIDLFAGIGGFHQAMTQLGGTCVFASEIDKHAIDVYKKNYGIDSGINVRDVKAEDIPEHDVLCGGFPCVAFSKAGKQEGFKDQIRGTLFFEIVRILEYHKTPYIILENVRNLVGHDGGNTWKVINGTLKSIGYRLMKEPLILSPYQFGVPQTRDRVVILGKYDPENVNVPLNIKFENLKKKKDNSIYTILQNESDVSDKYRISKQEDNVYAMWDEFYHGVQPKVIGFPIWSWLWGMEEPPKEYPDWKKALSQKNIDFYNANKPFIDSWYEKHNHLEGMTDTQKKFEWNAGTGINSVYDGIIQVRPSGVRVKQPDCYPALVAMVQTPVIGQRKRRITPREAARLQSFPDTFILDEDEHQAFKQLGNAVNVTVMRECMKKLFEEEPDNVFAKQLSLDF